MLSELEYVGLKEILDDIDDDDLFSILETVTKRMFSTKNRNEAIEKVLSCVTHPLDILKRQKLAKKILFNYLVKKGALALAEWSKRTLTEKCLELWTSTTPSEDSSSTKVEIEKKSCGNSERTEQMGVEFCKWFFKALNTLDGFGPQHFWPNCNLSAQLLSPSDQKEVSVSGANEVATFLANLIFVDKYFFHANDSKESIALEEEQHGLVKIMIHGVLHQYSTCIGLFDSAFGLVKHPDSPDTYKIQVIKVRMQVNMGTQRMLPPSNYLTACQRA